MLRRDFLKFTGLTASLGVVSRSLLNSLSLPGGEIYSTETKDEFKKLVRKALCEGWEDLHIGDCMGKTGLSLLGTPYEAYTLEGQGPEICRIDLKGLDCVTFFENVLCITRILKKDKFGFNDLIDEITFTRYRDGKIGDYTSRLHYTADWIYDNVKKGVVEDITQSLGGSVFPITVSYMSKHPDSYSALKSHPAYVSKIEKIEADINLRTYYYIPIEKVRTIEKQLQTGDIIAIATNFEGLDYSHTGLIYKDKGQARFLHASSKKKKVVLDVPLHEYVPEVKSNIGVTVARPLQPIHKL
jgi:hypothetical protein